VLSAVKASRGAEGMSSAVETESSARNVAAIVALLALVACYVVTYPALKPAVFIVPLVVPFFATRPFGSYLVVLIPTAILAVRVRV
jgi:hypothetical protein